MASIAQIEPLAKGVSINRRIFRAAMSVAAAGVLVKIVAMLKEVAVAGVYGRSDAMDAFLMAMLIPGLLVNLISESMNQALVPTLIRVRNDLAKDRRRNCCRVRCCGCVCCWLRLQLQWRWGHAVFSR
jgi:peptidoglycan biosynthesis protein MviN/MurJ (putative lipid II flippase)